MATKAKKIATIEGYNAMPIDAQMSISYAVGNLPVSATPEGVISAGVSWGLITTNGEGVALTKYGSDMRDLIIAHKDEIDDKMEEAARDAGGEAGGKYLDEIGLYELDKLSPEQWGAFVKKICTAYQYNRLKAIVSA